MGGVRELKSKQEAVQGGSLIIDWMILCGVGLRAEEKVVEKKHLFGSSVLPVLFCRGGEEGAEGRKKFQQSDEPGVPPARVYRPS